MEIINGELVLATLTEPMPFDMEMVVQSGRGYEPAEEKIDVDEDQELGRIFIDACFSPVRRVRYRTEDTRVGQRTNYDRLVLEIWTNGTIMPEMAMVEAGKILRKHLNPFVQYFELGEEIVGSAVSQVQTDVDTEMQQLLSKSIHELDLTVRATNCLEAAEIETVDQLVYLSEAELLKFRSFGKTSLREVKKKLEDIGLSLGMQMAASAGEQVELEH